MLSVPSETLNDLVDPRMGEDPLEKFIKMFPNLNYNEYFVF
jgi:hypothetical protein